MPLAQIYFSDDEDKIIREMCLKWDVSKQDAVKKIVLEYREPKMKGGD